MSGIIIVFKPIMFEDFTCKNRKLNNRYLLVVDNTCICDGATCWKQQFLRSASDWWKDKYSHCSVSLSVVSELKWPLRISSNCLENLKPSQFLPHKRQQTLSGLASGYWTCDCTEITFPDIFQVFMVFLVVVWKCDDKELHVQIVTAKIDQHYILFLSSSLDPYSLHWSLRNRYLNLSSFSVVFEIRCPYKNCFTLWSQLLTQSDMRLILLGSIIYYQNIMAYF